jgi:uncharacterized protein YndB with AHSA1/START domain
MTFDPNDTLLSTGGRNVLRMERRLAHAPEKVWRAITDPGQLAGWFPFRVELELRPQGRMRFLGGELVTEGVVTELEPPRLFAFDWNGDLLRFELEPDGAGCRLTFTHAFDDRAGAASFAAGWDSCLSALDTAVLGGGAFTPPDDRMAALHERYVAAFGLDAGSRDDGPTDWQVRFERQLTWPPQAVWELLADGAQPAPGTPPPPGFTTSGVAAGPVIAVEPPTMLEYDWLDGASRVGGRVRLQLGAGTGHGARLLVTQTGEPGDDDAAARALESWRGTIAALAARVAASPAPAAH